MTTKKKYTTLEKLSKKELIKEIVKIRPKADAYDRVCSTLGIKSNILSHINADKIFNVNSIVKVRLKESGFEKWKKYYNDCIPKQSKMSKVTVEELKAKRDDNGYNSLQMHELMEIFGEDLQVHDYFETNLILSGKDLK